MATKRSTKQKPAGGRQTSEETPLPRTPTTDEGEFDPSVVVRIAANLLPRLSPKEAVDTAFKLLHLASRKIDEQSALRLFKRETDNTVKYGPAVHEITGAKDREHSRALFKEFLTEAFVPWLFDVTETDRRTLAANLIKMHQLNGVSIFELPLYKTFFEIAKPLERRETDKSPRKWRNLKELIKID